MAWASSLVVRSRSSISPVFVVNPVIGVFFTFYFEYPSYDKNVDY
jgi:hypothetical protein